MTPLGGNITAELQVKTTTVNAIGERVPSWVTVHRLNCWLDFQSGDSSYTNHNAKLEESTHVFICDYVELQPSVKIENSRLLVDGEVYDITIIDDPMNLHYHLEIYLRYVGGQDG